MHAEPPNVLSVPQKYISGVRSVYFEVNRPRMFFLLIFVFAVFHIIWLPPLLLTTYSLSNVYSLPVYTSVSFLVSFPNHGTKHTTPPCWLPNKNPFEVTPNSISSDLTMSWFDSVKMRKLHDSIWHYRVGVFPIVLLSFFSAVLICFTALVPPLWPYLLFSFLMIFFLSYFSREF